MRRKVAIHPVFFTVQLVRSVSYVLGTVPPSAPERPGFDDATRQAGLRLDTPDRMRMLLKSGSTAVVPSDPEQSELLRRVTTVDETQRMPARHEQRLRRVPRRK